MSRISAILSKLLKKTNVVGATREVIYNKYVLYAVFLITLVNLLNAVVNQDYLYCILFALIGFLIAFFNKNMTVILVLTIAFATILNNIIRGSKLEGFDDSKKEKFDADTDASNLIDSSKGNSLNKLIGSTVSGKDFALDRSSGNTVTGNTSVSSTATTTAPAKSASPSPKVLMENLKEQALDSQAAQQEIISGFQQIEPHMQRAEGLIGSIQETAQTIQAMKTSKPV